MSTTIEVYPASGYMPMVEETRALTQELFQGLLDRRGVGSTIEVKTFLPSPTGPIRHVDLDLRWRKGLSLGFGYWVDGDWTSSSWPSCLEWDGDDLVTEQTARTDEKPDGALPDLLGTCRYAEDLAGVVPVVTLAKIVRWDHYWSEYRNGGGHAVASTGYGLAAAALAGATDGVIASWDSAFEIEHNGETAEQFLTWWGDVQIDFYGPDRFRPARATD